MEESLTRLATGASSLKAEQGLLDDLTAVMRDASICGLGQTAPNAVMSAISKLGVFP
jgi:NADH-quinone oxidoreductase subunit F